MMLACFEDSWFASPCFWTALAGSPSKLSYALTGSLAQLSQSTLFLTYLADSRMNCINHLLNTTLGDFQEAIIINGNSLQFLSICVAALESGNYMVNVISY
jgi:hypothetical protein